MQTCKLAVSICVLPQGVDLLAAAAAQQQQQAGSEVLAEQMAAAAAATGAPAASATAATAAATKAATAAKGLAAITEQVRHAGSAAAAQCEAYTAVVERLQQVVDAGLQALLADANAMVAEVVAAAAGGECSDEDDDDHAKRAKLVS